MPEASHPPAAEAIQLASASPASTAPAEPALSAANSSTSRTAYLPQLDGLRALAVILVFLHHAYAIPLLWSGVDLFFILSGYLITNILLRDSGRMPFGKLLGYFYLRRAQRILRALCTPLFSRSEAIYVLTPFRIDTMAAGALAALGLPRCNRVTALRWARLLIPLGLLAYVLLGMHPWFRRTANTPEFNGLAYSLNIVIFGGLFVWAVLAGPKDWLVRVLSTAPLRALGRISYSFYLLHLLVLIRFAPYFAEPVAPVAAFVLTVLLASISWYAIERPLLSLGGGQRGAAVKPPASSE